MALPEKRRFRIGPRQMGLFLCAILAVLSGVARAGSDYDDKDFSVRMAPAFLRFTEVSAMGGETAANRWSSAINPASAGWFSIPNKFGTVIAPYYSGVCFSEGMKLHVLAESVTWDSRKWGTFQPTVSQIRNSNGKTNQGTSFDYRVDTAQLQWGKRFGDWAVGANFNFAKAKIDQDIVFPTPGAPVPGTTTSVQADGDAESYRWRFGGLWQFAEQWLAGLVFEYGFQPYRSEIRTVTTIPLPIPPVTGVTNDSGTQQQFVLRPAVSWEYMDMSTISLDYQFGAFFNKDDCLQSHRWNVGVQHRVLEFLFLRGGFSFDQRGNLAGSCGLSLFLSKWAGLFLGYQYNMLPELVPEFGRAHTFQAGLNVRF